MIRIWVAGRAGCKAARATAREHRCRSVPDSTPSLPAAPLGPAIDKPRTWREIDPVTEGSPANGG
ncbi:hypothetical protein Maq22A_c27900 [Methylobacterium aquaticum]|uniref:Uncharacterized protein n=1 Tax=Methylobacterium aquaticum TaxID=270351 RepID=A0A1Y0ZFZ8_9HYPH|nr:hypothetical protein Maq22A_c27900 [Methylobacterium aquaticum]